MDYLKAWFSFCRFWVIRLTLNWSRCHVPSLGQQQSFGTLWCLLSVTKTPYHCIISVSLHCSRKSQWIHRLMLFLPTSQPTISMLQQKPGFISQCGPSVIWFWWSNVCCCLILSFAVRLGVLLLSVCFNMQRVVCSEMLCSMSLFLLRDVACRLVPHLLGEINNATLLWTPSLWKHSCPHEGI